MGPEATLDLYREILRATPAQKDQDHLRVIIDSNPKIPDRTPAITGAGASPVPAMAMSCLAVANAGADFVIIPCISAHFFLEELQQQIDIPILSAFEAVSEHIVAHHPDLTRVGLLATSGTVTGGRFAACLADQDITTIVPDENHQTRLMAAIYRIKSSLDPQVRAQCRADLIATAIHAISKGAQGIIAGCTEIPLELKPSDLSVPLFNPLAILAQAAVERAVRSI
jgi:aspartate racemase